MIPEIKRKSHWTLNISPWIIVGLAGVLLIIVVIMAIQNYSREKKYMSRILSEKGYALIKAVEAGARTGMMGMQWGKQQIRTLLQETAQMKDVLFLTIIREDGLILSHSEQDLISSRFDQVPDMNKPAQDHSVSWQIIRTDKYGRSFIVYSCFRPVSIFCDPFICMDMREMRQRQKKITGDWCFPKTKTNAKDEFIVILSSFSAIKSTNIS